jgi:serine/threonine protein kinase
VLENFHGIFKIDFDEIELKQKIGSGGFSDVHFAKWKGTIVNHKYRYVIIRLVAK